MLGRGSLAAKVEVSLGGAPVNPKGDRVAVADVTGDALYLFTEGSRGGEDEELVFYRTLPGEIGHEAFNVEAPLPFGCGDGPDLRRDPLTVVERHFPGSRALLAERGVRSLQPITEVFPVTRLEALLGVRPRHDFAVWLDELQRTNEHAERDPPWP